MNATLITFAGHLADAPELRFPPNGRAVARVRVAVNSRFQNSDGAWVDGNTSWHTVQAWGALAEHLAASVAKGDRVLVHGRARAARLRDRGRGQAHRVGGHR